MNEKKSDMIGDILVGISKQLPTDLTAEQMERIDRDVRKKWGAQADHQEDKTFSFALHCDEIAKLRSKLGFLANAVATCPPGDGVLADGEGLYFTLEGLWDDLKAIEDKVIAEHDRSRPKLYSQTTGEGSTLTN